MKHVSLGAFFIEVRPYYMILIHRYQAIERDWFVQFIPDFSNVNEVCYRAFVLRGFYFTTCMS